MSNRAQRHKQATDSIAIAQRRKTVAANLLAGATYAQISQVLNVSRATIASDYKAILSEWRALYAAKADDLIARQLRRYDVLLNGIWSEAQAGKESAIDRVLAIMDRQNNLMGIARPAPAEVNITPQTITIVEVNRLPEPHRPE